MLCRCGHTSTAGAGTVDGRGDAWLDHVRAACWHGQGGLRLKFNGIQSIICRPFTTPHHTTPLTPMQLVTSTTNHTQSAPGPHIIESAPTAGTSARPHCTCHIAHQLQTPAATRAEDPSQIQHKSPASSRGRQAAVHDASMAPRRVLCASIHPLIAFAAQAAPRRPLRSGSGPARVQCRAARLHCWDGIHRGLQTALVAAARPQLHFHSTQKHAIHAIYLLRLAAIHVLCCRHREIIYGRFKSPISASHAMCGRRIFIMF